MHPDCHIFQGIPKCSDNRMGRGRMVLAAEGLTKAFGGQTVLSRVSFELYNGDVVLLRGDNGSGKTTLLNILTGNLEPDSGCIRFFTNGRKEEFRFRKRWWRSLNPFDRFTPERVSGARVGRTWQDIRLFTTQTLHDNISLAHPGQLGENPGWVLLRPFSVRRQERDITAGANTILQRLGLEGRETSSADMISLGQSKRVAIARAVQAGARILFLDEPLAGLDAFGISEVTGLLKSLAQDEKVTLVIVEHVFNIHRVLDLATQVWTLDNGKMTSEKPVKIRGELVHAADGISGFVREAVKSGNKITKQNLTGGARLSIVGVSDYNSEDLVLEVKDLVVFRGRRLAIGEKKPNGRFKGLSFSLKLGQLAVLQAPNGWGKTTLLEAIAGILPIKQGSIKLNGQTIHGMPPWERTRFGLGFLQACNHSFPGLTVQETLRISHISNKAHPLSHLLGKRMSELSGGEKQKVSMACVDKKSSCFLMMDEPFSALDREGLKCLREVLKSSDGRTYLIAVPSTLKEEKNE